jgi:hypothetical protein
MGAYRYGIIEAIFFVDFGVDFLRY